MTMKNVLYTLTMSASLLYGALSFGKDNYTVYVENKSGGTIFYSFKKTSQTGKIIPGQTGLAHRQLNAGPSEIVSVDDFPAIKRSVTSRATEFTTLFASVNQAALNAVLGNTSQKATKEQKALVASKNMPSKIGTSCSMWVTFTITKKKSKENNKLSIAVEDKRTCE